ncbi:M10 family metallopeptidase [Pseudomonas citrulli]|uniref:M10 family metallopeptidase n=1 Tax=Pseudomonas citrulli TaxID=3064347 RepID=A0ABT9BZS4_9PSED|nr:M10 family metallopeptidase [Pseudomonas sp. K18]MDO7897505.1 M10 family metallopeptidase [Pseudomonas sp. K18]
MPSPIGYSFASPATLTGNAQVDSLLFGTYWLGNSWSTGTYTTPLTYSFITETSRFALNYSSDNEYEAGYVLTAAQQAGISSALFKWSSVANIKFTQVSESSTEVGDLRFGGFLNMDSDTAAWGYFPDNAPSAGDVWLGPVTNDPAPVNGTYDYLVFVHEIGHALGLKHPFSQSPSNTMVLATQFDDVRYTVMSYNSGYSFEPTSPMLLDIAAIQSLYGANTQWQTGNNTYSWAADQSVFETIWDAGGNDTIDASNQAAAVRIDLNEGQFSKIGQAFTNLSTQAAFNEGLAIAYGAKIENAIGSVNDDTLIGNALGNILNGLGGKDIMIGGAGNDTYAVDDLGDVVSETSTLAGEIDTVQSSVSWSLGANLENLTLIGTAHLSGGGNYLNNVMIGNAGNNVLDGGSGIDTLIGGNGNDIYVVDNLKDVVSESSALASEIDTVLASVNWSLGANLENLTLIGTANLSGGGNFLDNVMTGNAGNNVLDGGSGIDTLIGGAGNDIYVVDNLKDVISETSSIAGEIDTVLSSVSWSLGANLENLTLTGASNLSGGGNFLNNVMTGNAGNNVLDGGSGIDTLIGGAGNDIYVVDNLKDVISETSTQASEVDTVLSSVDWSLGANLENLTLIGAGNVSGGGNFMNNVMTGNAGNNVLAGGGGNDRIDGGAGNDILVGGTGTDTLTGGTGGDRFVFSALNEMGLGSASDTILDFSSLQGDKLDLSNVVANLQNALIDTFSFIDSNDFTGAGQLRFVDQVLYGNVNGDLGADFEIQLVGVTSLSANDLIA